MKDKKDYQRQIKINARIDNIETGCWIWQRYKNKLGYGMVYFPNKYNQRSAHRLSYIVFKGKIKKGYEIDHLCRNPSCVNPDHLEMVTHKVNVQRGLMGDLRYLMPKVEFCKSGHPFSAENTRLAKQPNGRFKRVCKTCMRRYKKNWRAKQI